MSTESGIPRGVAMIVDPPVLGPPALCAVRAYWEEKRGGRAMPCRADIDPVDLKSYLASIFMLDVIPRSSDFRFRLLGTGITERYGRDSTGKTLREVYAAANPGLFEWLTSMLTTVVRSKRPVLTRGPLRAVQKEFVAFESIHLPLSEDGETVNIIFGATHFVLRDPGEAV